VILRATRRGLVLDGDALRLAIFGRRHTLRSFALRAGISWPTMVKAVSSADAVDSSTAEKIRRTLVAIPVMEWPAA
jgi:hypothetical protein